MTTLLDIPCLCGLRRRTGDCCLRADGSSFRAPIPLVPPEKRTGYSHPQCYAAGTGDCSKKISREHYISETVLKELGDTVSVLGPRWHGSGERRNYTLPNLTAKVLCERHNSRLSRLDREAGQLFRFLRRTAELFATTYRTHPVRRLMLVSGEAIQAWLLKVLCGFVAANVLPDRGRTWLLDKHLPGILFGDAEWPDEWGLYVQVHGAAPPTRPDSLQFNVLRDGDTGAVLGLDLVMVGFTLRLLATDLATWARFDATDGLLYRPGALQYRFARSEDSIALAWADGRPRGSGHATIALRGSTEPPADDLPMIVVYRN